MTKLFALFKKFLVCYLSVFLFSCSSKSIDDTEEDTNCFTTDINVTSADNIVNTNSSTTVFWEGFYTADVIKISYTKTVSSDNETETFVFVFDKTLQCVKPKYAYKFYNGKEVAIAAVTEMTIIDNGIKFYEKDKLIAGFVSYTDPHDKQNYSIKFWVDNLIDEATINQEKTYFSDCFGDKLPIEIDVNEDNIPDFILDYKVDTDTGNTPNYKTYAIQVKPATSGNSILSPISNTTPHSIVFEPPFSSKNATKYTTDVKQNLDVFYEFDEPYSSYNFFLNNNLTYGQALQNNIPDYFVVSKEINGKQHFGWIKFELDVTTCKVNILFAYLNGNPETHVEVK